MSVPVTPANMMEPAQTTPICLCANVSMVTQAKHVNKVCSVVQKRNPFFYWFASSLKVPRVIITLL